MGTEAGLRNCLEQSKKEKNKHNLKLFINLIVTKWKARKHLWSSEDRLGATDQIIVSRIYGNCLTHFRFATENVFGPIENHM